MLLLLALAASASDADFDYSTSDNQVNITRYTSPGGLGVAKRLGLR